MDIHLYDDDEAPEVEHGATQAVAVAEAVETAAPGPETPVHDRRGYLGGSDAAVVAGLSPWKTPYQLYLEKTGEEEPADLSGNERVYWGQVLEEIVAREYAQRTGNKVRRVKKLLKHSTYPFIRAHIDRDVLGTTGILEVKTTGRRDEWGEPGTDDIPDYYYAQAQHNMAVAGAAWCDVPVLFAGQEYRPYSVARDEEFIAGLISMEVKFWGHVERREPPEPETSDEASEMWPRGASGTAVWGNEAAEFAAQRLYEVKTRMKELEAEKDNLEAELKRQLADIGDKLYAGGQVVATWKGQTRRHLDTKRLKEEQPELAEQYETEKELRVFRLTYKPGKE